MIIYVIFDIYYMIKLVVVVKHIVHEEFIAGMMVTF